jgi:hypothetical protein
MPATSQHTRTLACLAAVLPLIEHTELLLVSLHEALGMKAFVTD